MILQTPSATRANAFKIRAALAASQGLVAPLQVEERAVQERAVVQLTVLDLTPGQKPKAAISLGDSDSANYVSTLAFGISTDASDPASSVGAALSLHRETTRQLHGNREVGCHRHVARYDSGGPDTVTGDEKAILGASAYASYLDGVHAVNAGATRVAIGHSYGTRLLSIALSTGGSADAAILLGSPGVADSVTHADQIAVPAVRSSPPDQIPTSWRVPSTAWQSPSTVRVSTTPTRSRRPSGRVPSRPRRNSAVNLGHEVWHPGAAPT